jgi:hypothetical protein
MVPVVGHCRECGDDLGTEVTLRATQDWVDQYQYDDRMRRTIDHAVVRLVVARHGRRCVGRPRQPLALAPSARRERASAPRHDRPWDTDDDPARDSSPRWGGDPVPGAAALKSAGYSR